MKIAVAGKGGSGKTTVAGTIARAIGQQGLSVVALDADANPMLGISLGLGPEQTDILVAARQALDAGEMEHQPSATEIVATFGTDAPDGVRLVVVSRIDQADPGWPWCGLAPEQLLGELEDEGRVVVFDMEAGAGTLLRMRPGVADVVLIVADPSAKSIEVAQRLAQIAATRARVIVVANQIRGPEDAHVLREAFGDHELVEIPYEPSIVHAERRGLAPIDIDRDCSGVAALRSLAERLATPQPT